MPMTAVANLTASVRGICLLLAVLLISSSRATSAAAQYRSRIISQPAAHQLGLTRSWFAQVEINPARHRVESWILSNDELIVLTTAGVLQSLNAHTGETHWVSRFGNPDYPSLGPAANDHFLALINGSTLYVLNRSDGRILIEQPLGGAPGAGPALSEDYVFVPLVSGRIEGYPLSEETSLPWFYKSFGKAMITPCTTPDSVVWTTDQGFLYVGGAKDPEVRYRFESGSPFIASPAAGDHMLYAVSITGELYALSEEFGLRRWKYGTGFPASRSPAVVDDCIYVTTHEPALHSINAVRGTANWVTNNVAQFAAASKSRIFGVDGLGNLVAMDAATGGLFGSFPLQEGVSAMVNDQTDRLYLISDTGLVQCLHEIGATEPLYHNQSADSAQPSDTEQPTEAPSPRDEVVLPPQDFGEPEPQEPAADDDPFDGFGTPIGQDENTPDDENPFGVEENPFDF